MSSPSHQSSAGIALLPAVALLTMGLVGGYIIADVQQGRASGPDIVETPAGGADLERLPALQCPPTGDVKIDGLRNQIAVLQEETGELKDYLRIAENSIFSCDIEHDYTRGRRRSQTAEQATERRRREREEEEAARRAASMSTYVERADLINASISETEVFEHAIRVVGYVSNRTSEEMSGWVVVGIISGYQTATGEVWVVASPGSRTRFSLEVQNPFGKHAQVAAFAEWRGNTSGGSAGDDWR